MSDLKYLRIRDYSHWDVPENYQDHKAVISAAYAKATEGDWFHDSAFGSIVWNFEQIGVLTGAYHYYRESADPKKQAWLFYQIAKTRNLALPPALDIEKINNPKLDPKRVFICIQEIERLFGRRPIIYTGYYVWRDYMKSADFGRDYLLWIATYGSAPLIPAPWAGWTIWQYTDKPYDENWFNGGLSDLEKFVNGSYKQGVLPAVPKPIDPTKETLKPTKVNVAADTIKLVWKKKTQRWVPKKKARK